METIVVVLTAGISNNEIVSLLHCFPSTFKSIGDNSTVFKKFSKVLFRNIVSEANRCNSKFKCWTTIHTKYNFELENSNETFFGFFLTLWDVLKASATFQTDLQKCHLGGFLKVGKRGKSGSFCGLSEKRGDEVFFSCSSLQHLLPLNIISSSSLSVVYNVVDFKASRKLSYSASFAFHNEETCGARRISTPQGKGFQATYLTLESLQFWWLTDFEAKILAIDESPRRKMLKGNEQKPSFFAKEWRLPRELQRRVSLLSKD